MNKLHIILVTVLVALVAVLIPVTMGQDIAPSAGCAGLEGGLDATTYGPSAFIDGDKVLVTVTGDVTSWSVSINGADESGTLTVTQFQYKVDQDGELTIDVTVTGTGTVAISCTPAGEDDSNSAELCHVPPGNPDAAHTITVGAPAVKAHLAHGDFLGNCGELESFFINAGALEDYVAIMEDDAANFFGICIEGECTLVASVDYDTLIAYVAGLGEASEDSEASGDDDPVLIATFDENTADDWWVDVYYLGYQDRNGDGEFQHVFQLNLYVADTLISDDVLIFVVDDGVSWGSH